ncbi:HD domain-containing protein [Carnobacteriaceae bacterium zg-ZUI240]|nr:HD domain-containing protein [Carnobacteriaceae bacterium zg-ZUI240]
MLTSNEKNTVIQFVHDKLAQDTTGHGIDHIERVVRLTQSIVQHEPSANEDVCWLAAYLHDVIDDKLVNDVQKAQQEVIMLLSTLSITQHQQDEIMLIINTMSFSKQLEKSFDYTINAKIVQDADRLDAIGAVGIARTFVYAGAKGSVLYDESIKPRLEMTKEAYRHEKSTAINHFYEKLLLLKDRMHTQTAKQMAQKRHELMLLYLENFYAEWEGRM